MDIFGFGADLIQTGINYGIQKDLTDRDRRQNYLYGEMAAKNADKRTRALYSDFYSPEALKRQYEEAGLSPSLMFGGTPGQGGMSGAQGTGANGPTTPYMPLSLLEAAQISKINAETEKTKEETAVLAGDNKLGAANISKTLAEAGHAKAAAAAAEAEAKGQEIANYVAEATKDASIYQICEMAEQQAHATMKMYHEMRSAKVLADIDEATYGKEVQKRGEELNFLLQQIKTSKSQERLNDQQVKDLKDQILARIEETRIKWKAVEVQEKQATSYADWIDAQIPYIEQQIELKLKELGIEKSRVIVDGITNLFKSIAIGAAAASQLGLGKTGKGGDLSPQPGEPSYPFN